MTRANKWFVPVVLILSIAIAVCHVAAGRVSAQQGMKITVIAGEDAVNVIGQRTAVAPIVEVRDRNNTPVAGAVVTFTIGGGQNATFAGGFQSVTVTTNATGRATAASLNSLTSGRFQIQVQATYQGESASATVTQTNFNTEAQARAARGNPANGGQAGQAGAGGQATQAGAAVGAAGATGGGLSGLTVGAIVAGAGATAVVVATTLGGGEPQSPQGSTPTLNLAGTWVGTFGSFPVNLNGVPQGRQNAWGLRWTVTQNGSSFSGPITFSVTTELATPITVAGVLAGNLNANNVLTLSLDVRPGGVSAPGGSPGFFDSCSVIGNGMATSTGTTISGTLADTFAGCQGLVPSASSSDQMMIGKQ